jgi:hypothetical protein
MKNNDIVEQNKKQQLALLSLKLSPSIYQIGSNITSISELHQDVLTVAKQLMDFFDNNVKNYEFVAFDDKQFCEAFKAMIKDKEFSSKFLNIIKISPEEFFSISTYICPTCFTTNLIKYIRTKILKNKK